MANIFPSKEFTDFSDSHAEEIVYDELAQLPDSYKIYHSEDWFRAMGQSSRDQERGEIDFLICHRENGILAVEVKGGGIEYDPEKDQWWTIGKDGRNRLKKSPALQAQAGSRCLLERLKEHPKIEENDKFTGVIGWGLFFPQMSYEDGLDLPDMTLPRERILFQENRAQLLQFLEDLYAYWDNEYHFTGPMDTSTWQKLNNSFLPNKLRILESLEAYVERAENVIYRATKEQQDLIEHLSRQNNVYIRGCAGSGKTLLSLEKARRLSAEDKSVLWLCYNKDLANAISNRRPDADFEINHFHSFADNFIRDAGLEIPYPNMVEDNPDSDDWHRFFSEELPALLEDALEFNDTRYDAIIIDEAQDFDDYWYMVISDLFSDQDERWFYVFYDPHQSVYGELPDWIAESDSSAITINNNIRNNENVGQPALRLGQINEEVTFEHEGQKSRLSLVDDEDEISEKLRKAFHEIFMEEELDPGRSVILGRHTKKNSPLAGIDKLGNFEIIDGLNNDSQSVSYSTIHSYKGLEADIVFLLIPEWDEDHAQEFYTGSTRPKHLLWMFSADNKIMDLVPEDCVTKLS